MSSYSCGTRLTPGTATVSRRQLRLAAASRN